jgi:hypothetical protein
MAAKISMYPHAYSKTSSIYDRNAYIPRFVSQRVQEPLSAILDTCAAPVSVSKGFGTVVRRELAISANNSFRFWSLTLYIKTFYDYLLQFSDADRYSLWLHCGKVICASQLMPFFTSVSKRFVYVFMC